MAELCYPCSSFLSGCGRHDWRDDFKTDCFHYTEDHDMGATIPWCGHTHTVIERKKCDNCKHYISKADVYEFASHILEERRADDGN